MKTLILMTLAILVTRWLRLPLVAINLTAPGVTDRRAISFSATGFLQLITRLARQLNDRFREYLSRLVIKCDYHSLLSPG